MKSHSLFVAKFNENKIFEPEEIKRVSNSGISYLIIPSSKWISTDLNIAVPQYNSLYDQTLLQSTPSYKESLFYLKLYGGISTVGLLLCGIFIFLPHAYRPPDIFEYGPRSVSHKACLEGNMEECADLVKSVEGESQQRLIEAACNSKKSSGACIALKQCKYPQSCELASIWGQCHLGSASACLRLAKSSHGDKDQDTIKALLERACEGSKGEACVRLAGLLPQEQISTIKYLYWKSCSMNYEKGCQKVLEIREKEQNDLILKRNSVVSIYKDYLSAYNEQNSEKFYGMISNQVGCFYNQKDQPKSEVLSIHKEQFEQGGGNVESQSTDIIDFSENEMIFIDKGRVKEPGKSSFEEYERVIVLKKESDQWKIHVEDNRIEKSCFKSKTKNIKTRREIELEEKEREQQELIRKREQEQERKKQKEQDRIRRKEEERLEKIRTREQRAQQSKANLEREATSAFINLFNAHSHRNSLHFYQYIPAQMSCWFENRGKSYSSIKKFYDENHFSKNNYYRSQFSSLSSMYINKNVIRITYYLNVDFYDEKTRKRMSASGNRVALMKKIDGSWKLMSWANPDEQKSCYR
ncbi:hypothetical protein KJ940_17240 [Myxococcota bacterium]|nr:hypothetical protein [Myxococcota bacterium]